MGRKLNRRELDHLDGMKLALAVARRMKPTATKREIVDELRSAVRAMSWTTETEPSTWPANKRLPVYCAVAKVRA